MRARAHRVLDHLRRQWMGALALFLVLTGGVAYAANTIASGDIIDGEVKTADLAANAVNSARIADGQVTLADIGQGAVATEEIANGQVKAADLGDGEVKAAEVATAAVRTEELANGQVQAEDLAPGVAPGASGARAWGLVSNGGALLRSKQVTSVTHPDNGIYCIDPAPGIDPTAAVLSVAGESLFNSTNSGSDDIGHVEWSSDGPNCPAGAMEVRSFIGDGRPGSGGEFDSGGFDMILEDQGFAFVIP